MKLIAAILAALVLFLSVQEPVLSAWIPAPQKKECSAQKSCRAGGMSCKKELPSVPGKEKPVSCCELLFCNPFGACCSYVPAERPVLSAGCFLLQTKIADPVNENFLASYIKEVWHPPESGFTI
jgi:hypothetical protein